MMVDVLVLEFFGVCDEVHPTELKGRGRDDMSFPQAFERHLHALRRQ
jgi:hypothetical protein